MDSSVFRIRKSFSKERTTDMAEGGHENTATEKILHGELADQVKDYTGNLRRVFRQVVKKVKAKDGGLAAPEILRVLRLLGMNPTETEIFEMIYKNDNDGKGKLTEDGFIYAMMENMKISDTEDEIMQIFRMFDKDGNGFIDTAELKTMFEFAVGPNTGFTMLEATSLLEELDIDGDSLLNYKEFVKIFTSTGKTEEQDKNATFFDV